MTDIGTISEQADASQAMYYAVIEYLEINGVDFDVAQAAAENALTKADNLIDMIREDKG